MLAKGPLGELSREFALDIISYCDQLYDNKKYKIGDQLLRSGTSIGANNHEANSAQSRKDFINKLKIAHKEALETEYWIFLCQKSNNFPDPTALSGPLQSILKMLNKAIATSISKLE
ncbi:MAG: four helix bundle protein [Flavobacteriales bacterium]